MTVHGPMTIAGVASISWKNGGGSTRTLASAPEDAGLDNFLWRISLAEISAAGSFSCFPGIDRTILLWEGEGVVLHSTAWPDHDLTELRKPFAFAGEDEVWCDLAGGSTSDLNLMVRRGEAVGTMLPGTETVRLSQRYDDVVVLCASGTVDVGFDGGARMTVEAGQFVRISGASAEIAIVPRAAGAAFVYATMLALER